MDTDSYGQASRFIVRRLHRCAEESFVVVVSAQDGLTDELDGIAPGINKDPNPTIECGSRAARAWPRLAREGIETA